MVSVELHVFAQIFTAFVSSANALYYFYVYKCTRKGHLMKWEVAWVATIETINYIIQLATGSQRIELASGAKFPWMRYVGWQLTCPVLLAFVVLNMLEKPNTRLVIQMLMLLQFIILSGMTASLADDMGIKALFVTIAAVMLIILYATLYSNRKHQSMPASNNKAYHILLYFMASWLVFPALFILGPEMTNIIPFEFTLVGHCVGDLISKNAFGLLAWQYTLYIYKKKQKASALPITNTDQRVYQPKIQMNDEKSDSPKPTYNSTTHVTLPLHLLNAHMLPYGLSRPGTPSGSTTSVDPHSPTKGINQHDPPTDGGS